MIHYQLELFEFNQDGKIGVPIILFDRPLTSKQVTSLVDATNKEFDNLVELQHDDSEKFYVHATFFYIKNQKAMNNLRTRLREVLNCLGYKEV